MRIAIVGKGNVGTAIATGLSQKGYEVRFGHRDPKEPVEDAAKWGEVIVLAVPFSEVKNAVKEIGSAADGKTLIDATNALGPSGELAVGFTTSGAEELQKVLPKARVVKAFNTVFAKNQSTGRVGNNQLTAFIAGDDLKAKRTVMQITKDIGFEPLDAGPLKAARHLESMAKLIIDLAYTRGMGTDIGFKLVKG